MFVYTGGISIGHNQNGKTNLLGIKPFLLPLYRRVSKCLFQQAKEVRIQLRIKLSINGYNYRIFTVSSPNYVDSKNNATDPVWSQALYLTLTLCQDGHRLKI